MKVTVKTLARDVAEGKITAEAAVPLIHDLMFPKGGKYVHGAGHGKDPEDVWESMAAGDMPDRNDNSFDEVSLQHNIGRMTKAQYEVLLGAIHL